jgi:serine/threonine-protein kinase
MIDGQGRVRITDFGLAGFAGEFAGKEVHAGTPAYMAPEQLAGRAVSVKSDLYALGLVLAELFTGKRVFEDATRDAGHRARSAAPTSLALTTDGMDPAVERVILRCLEADPAARPPSAIAVAAALPGGDPLAAALAAGETPDPAMVAAGGEVGGLRPALAVPCLLAILSGIAAIGWINDRTSLFRLVPLPKTPDVLADRAADLLKKAGHDTPVADISYGFGTDSDYMEYIEEHDASPSRWAKLGNARPEAVYFWHRESPAILVPPDSKDQAVSLEQPPLSIAGMTAVLLDPAGRLRSLKIVPPEYDDSPRAGEGPLTEWSSLFAEAGLEFAAFSRVDPIWNPAVNCDERAAWQGMHPTDPSGTLRVEAGAYRGKPSFFQVIGPWVKTARMELGSDRPQKRVGGILALVVVLSAVFGSFFLAGRNIRLKRGDRSGAFRLAMFLGAANMLHWVVGAKHVPDPWGEFGRFETAMRWATFEAARIWIVYLALEPYVRRRWPQVLISWTRLLAGRFRDPLVGTDILMGALLGVTMLLLQGARDLLPVGLESARASPPHFAFEPLLGGRHVIAALLDSSFVFPALFLLFILFGLRTVLRKQSLAVVAFLMLFGVIGSLTVPSASYGAGLCADVLLGALIASVWLVLLMRFGLLATTAAFFFADVLGRFPITLDFSTWYVGATLTAMLTVVAVAAYSFHVALAGRPIFNRALLDG